MMPMYDYKCECGNVKEIIHGFVNEPTIICEKCHKEMAKQFGSPVVSFSGGGFYSTDKND